MRWKILQGRHAGYLAVIALAGASIVVEAGAARAQEVRQTTPTPAPTPSRAPSPATTVSQIDPQLLAVIDPLEVEIQALRAEVQSLRAELEKLKADLGSLRQAYAQHKHSIPYFGVTSAKTIYPGTPASDDTLVAITCQPCAKAGLSGPPAQ